MTRVVILGGGSAGWMCAAMLVRQLGHLIAVTLIESEEIGIVGVGEATLPHMRDFVAALGIEERAFMTATDATYKLGISFTGFGATDARYFHPFGGFGEPLAGVDVHHYWLQQRHVDPRTPDFDAHALATAMANAGRFAPPPDDAAQAQHAYAYHFDTTKLGPFLRRYAEERGVLRHEARVVSVDRDAMSGDVAALVLGDGSRVTGDLFLDCSGFRALLIGGALDERWIDWSHWLPCDRAVALPCGSADETIEPFTRAVAMAAGWRWRIPLRTRVGNGYVFSSAHTDEATATEDLMRAIEGEPRADPRVLRFAAGRRERAWVNNVVAIGLSGGFLEPLESTSIYLVQTAIKRLIDLFPLDGGCEPDRSFFNAALADEYGRIRDFLIAHYHVTRRRDTPFWRDMAKLALPDTLAARLTLWSETAQVAACGEGPFFPPSWQAVLLGQGLLPHGWDARAALPDPARLGAALRHRRNALAQAAAAMPRHADAFRAMAA